MSNRDDVTRALTRAADASNDELSSNPAADTGSCTISSAGYSECRNDTTETACRRQEAPGFTVTWRRGERC